jgi:hypothetical protein
MTNVNKKKFLHDKSYDLFEDHKMLALHATMCGMTVQEFVKMYGHNLRDSAVLNTASFFRGIVKDVRTEDNGDFITAWIDYEVRSGTAKAETGTIRVGIIDPANKEADKNKLCTKAKNLLGKKALFTKCYTRKDDADYAVLMDIEGV